MSAPASAAPSAPTMVAAPAGTPEDDARARSTLARSDKGRRRVLLIVGAGAALIAGYLAWHAIAGHDQTTDDAQVEADVVPLAPRVGGQVAVVRVADNAAVHKGDVLVELDTTDLKAKVKQAEGELAAARAQAASAEAQARVVEAGARGGLSTARAQMLTTQAQVSGAAAQVANARAQVVRAEAEARRAIDDLARTRALKQAGASSQEALDHAQVTADGAQAALLAAKAQLLAAEESRRGAQGRVAEARGQLDSNIPVDAKVAAARASADLAQARVTTAEAALDLARLQLSWATVTAPSDGVVSRLGVHAGQVVSAGMTIAELVPHDTYVVANFKETQVGAMRLGQPVTLEIDAYGGRRFQGEVESISGGTGSRFSLLPPDNASGNFVKVVQRVPVRIRWKDLPSDVTLRAGLSVVATVRTAS